MSGDLTITGSDGRRWFIANGGGRVTELKSVEPPAKPKPAKRKPK